jgi:hypothetical protein
MNIHSLLLELDGEFGMGIMPSLEYATVAWLLRLACVAIACGLWYLSIRSLRKNKWLIPKISRLFAYLLLFCGCFEMDIIMYQCLDGDCSYERHQVSVGILGVCFYHWDDFGGVTTCRCPDFETKVQKVAEARCWGGLIAFLPCRSEVIHKLSGGCPCCGQPVMPSDIEAWQTRCEELKKFRQKMGLDRNDDQIYTDN